MIKYTTLLLLMTLITFAYGQCSLPESSQFDFWVGDWTLTWKNGKGETITGSNKIEKILGECVVAENFSGIGGFTGKSWSIYNGVAGKWQQTWVDNKGGTFVLEGQFENGEMTLTTQKIKTREGMYFYRMRFTDITDNSLEWHWQSSADGAEWTDRWHISYKRK